MTNIDVLDLPRFVERCLHKHMFDTVEALAATSDAELCLIPDLDPEAVKEIRHKLNRYIAQHTLSDDTPLSLVKLSKRTYNALRRSGVDRVEHLVAMSDEDLMRIRNFGEKSLAEVHEKLTAYVDIHGPLNPGQSHYDSDSYCSPQQDDEPECEMVRLSAEEILATLPAQQPVERLGLPARAYNALKEAAIDTVERLVLMNEEELLDVRNIGDKSLKDIQRKLEAYLEHHPLPKEFMELVRQYKSSGVVQLPLTPPDYEEVQPRQPEFLIDSDLRDCASDLPLDDISIERLVLPEHIHNELLFHQIESAGTLLQQTADTFVQPELLREQLSKYINWLLHQEEGVWWNEIAGRGLSPIYRIMLEETSTDTFLTQWFAGLSERERQILYGRYGLQGSESTLVQLGDKLDLTRERVRQLQNRAERKLSKPGNLQKVEPLTVLFYQVVVESGGLIDTQQFRESLREFISVENFDLIGVANLIFGLDDKVKSLRSPRGWRQKEIPLAQIRGVQKQFVALLDREGVPLSTDQLMKMLKDTKFYQSHSSQLDDVMVEACLRTHPGLRLREGQWYLKKHSWTRLAALILALRQIGEPAHYEVIAERTNALLPENLHRTTHNIHAELGRRPEVFVRVGHGVFGLVEWGLDDDGCVANAIHRVLMEAGKPLHYEIITDRVLETWKVRPESVYAALSVDERFISIGSGVYWTRDQEMTEPCADFGDLFGTKLAQRQKDIDRWDDSTQYDAHDEVDLLRGIGTDFFSG